MSKKIGFKNAYALGQIKYGLDKEGKKAIESLSAEEQERLAQLQRKDDPNLVEEVNKAIGVDDGFTSKNQKIKKL